MYGCDIVAERNGRKFTARNRTFNKKFWTWITEKTFNEKDPAQQIAGAGEEEFFSKRFHEIIFCFFYST